MEEFVYFLIVMALSIALAPKPKPPKAAALEDFDVPTAEEGRPIPVVFGDVLVSGPNVLWYGDLVINKIKKSSGFSRATVGYKYFLGFHCGICHGPVDAVTGVVWDEKVCWEGSLTANGVGAIDKESLFGGESRGGGISGDFDVMFGEDAQGLNTYLFTQTPAGLPAYRGIISFVWKRGYIGTSEFLKPVALRVRRVIAGWESAVWYPDKAAVGGGMNGAHIIYEALTNSKWGMGIPTSRVSDAKFASAADILFDEGFGLSLIWNQQSSIEEFIQIILNHIGGGLTLRLSTGLYELTLLRGGYDPATLPLYDPSNVTDVSSFQRQGWGLTVNEVTLIYTDPDSLKETSITGQDLGNVEAQGALMPAIVEYRGIRDHDVAAAVLSRELAMRTTPLTKATVTVNRAGWNLGFGDLFRLTWPARKCDERVFRVLKVNRGTLQNNSIVIEALEDIFQYPQGSGLSAEPSTAEDSPPPTPPEDPDDDTSIISFTTPDPPTSPEDGDAYFLPPGSTGDWTGHDGQLARWDALLGEWEFVNIPDGSITWAQDEDVLIVVNDGIATPIIGSGATTSVAGGYAVDKGYLWYVKSFKSPGVVPGGMFERRVRGLGVVHDFRYIVSDGDFPHAVYIKNANTGEALGSLNTGGYVLDICAVQGERYYYAAGIDGPFSSHQSIVRKIDTYRTDSWYTAAAFTDGDVDRFQSVCRIGDIIYAVGHPNDAENTRIYRLTVDTLEEIGHWSYAGVDAPFVIRTEGANLWFISLAGDYGEINLLTGIQENLYTPDYPVGYDAVTVYDYANSRWELWVSHLIGGGDPARLVAYRLVPGGLSGHVERSYTHATSFLGDLVHHHLAQDGELVSWGRAVDPIVITTRDTNLWGYGQFDAFEVVTRPQYTARVRDFYKPAFLPQIDALPDVVEPETLLLAKTFIPLMREAGTEPERMSIEAVLALRAAAIPATDVTYDSSLSGINADNVQEALDAITALSAPNVIIARAFANGLFYGQSALDLFDSTDGLTWTPRSNLGETALSQLIFLTTRYFGLAGSHLKRSVTSDVYGDWTSTVITTFPLHGFGGGVTWQYQREFFGDLYAWSNGGPGRPYGVLIVKSDDEGDSWDELAINNLPFDPFENFELLELFWDGTNGRYIGIGHLREELTVGYRFTPQAWYTTNFVAWTKLADLVGTPGTDSAQFTAAAKDGDLIGVALTDVLPNTNVAFAWSDDAGATWTLTDGGVGFPVVAGEPAGGIVFDGTQFVFGGSGYSGVTIDFLTWTFSDGTSGLPETALVRPLTDGAGTTVATLFLASSSSVAGSAATTDGLHWDVAPNIPTAASDVSFDDAYTGLGVTTVQEAIELLAVQGSTTRGATWVRASAPIATPVNDVPIYFNAACTIAAVSILTTGGAGSCVVDIWKTPSGGFPAVDADSITAGNEPEIAGGTWEYDNVLTGWDTAIAAGDTLTFHLDSSSTFTGIFITLHFI